MIAKSWQCINECTVFETVGEPTYCPHCGSRELFPKDEGVERYDTYDERYVNWETGGE